MQSGISASPALLSAFSSFTSSPALFALPITIASESLHPLESLPFASQSSFSQNLASLAQHLAPATPIYLLIRRTPDSEKFVAITYVPSTAPVRAKTLFASTRNTLVRELGGEKFEGSLFVTDAEEILDIKFWEERDGVGNENGGRAGEGTAAEQRLALLSVEERELEGIKRAEAEERHGTKGRGLGGLGGGEGGAAGAGGGGIRMKMEDEVKSALQSIAGEDEGGKLVMLGIDIPTETLKLMKQTEVSPEELSKTIPSDKPSYSFYRHPQAAHEEGLMFIYVCPGSSKVKERMLYASSRRGVLAIAAEEGVNVGKRLEAGAPEEVSEQRLREEVGGSDAKEDGANAGGDGPGTVKGGFARPKKPGRR